MAPQVRASAIRRPLLRAVSKWPRRFGAVRTRHCFLTILHGSLLVVMSGESWPVRHDACTIRSVKAVPERALTIPGADRFTRRGGAHRLHAIYEPTGH